MPAGSTAKVLPSLVRFPSSLLIVVAGAWTIHVVLIICLKIFYDTLPGVSQETSWTLTNISYMAVCITLLHFTMRNPACYAELCCAWDISNAGSYADGNPTGL
jgi:ORMDL family